MVQTLHRTESSANARLAADTLAMQATEGVPTWMLHVMDIAFLEYASGHPRGAYCADPDTVYLDFQRAAGVCMIDQYLADNPLTMTAHGYGHGTTRGASTGAETIVLDEITIDSPESVAAHLERFVFPPLAKQIAATNPDDEAAVTALIERERAMQTRFGPSILKVPYGEAFQHFPYLRYTTYGYVDYLTAFLAYPELMEKDFALQADLAVKKNALAARAVVQGRLPKTLRLDHDMADGRGTLVDVRALDALWFPHFERAIQPYLEAGIRLIWHCDGNLMEMAPRLIDAGIGGFQGFQYEDGMDYDRICRMRTRGGDPLLIWAGVSVTRTLPFGTADNVRQELDWLVRQGPPVGLFLGASSSITPGVKWDNLRALIEGLAYYRNRGR
jgi:hypothetical protein